MSDEQAAIHGPQTADGDLGGYAGTREKLIEALESAGIIFVEEKGEGPACGCVRLLNDNQRRSTKDGAPIARMVSR